jgi:TolA-binding protein
LHDYLITAFATVGKAGEAARVLDKAAHTWPESEGAPPALFKAAMIYSRAGETDKAITLLREITTQHAQHALTTEAVFGTGALIARKGNINEAVAVFQDFIRTHSDNASLTAKAKLGIAQCYEYNRKNP